MTLIYRGRNKAASEAATPQPSLGQLSKRSETAGGLDSAELPTSDS